MANEFTPTPEPVSPPASTPTPTPVSAYMDINTTVSAAISGSNPKVREAIIDDLVQTEVSRRVKAGTSVVKQLREMDLQLRKLKPDLVAYGEDHKPVGVAAYSPKVNEERKKLEEKINKHGKALEKALVNGDYGDLFNLDKPEETK